MIVIAAPPASTLMLAASVTISFPPSKPHTMFVIGTEQRRFVIARADERSRIPVFNARKTPIEEIDYGFDWTAWLNADEKVFDSGWVVSPDDGSLTLVTSTFNDTSSTVWVLDGKPGIVYTLTNTIFTDSTPVQRHAQRSMQLLIVSVR